jgi:hypothetical protein
VAVVINRSGGEEVAPPPLTAERIAAVLARNTFEGDLVCPNCYWTGHEADLLVVHASLRLIDVEIKISRSDLVADRKKRKWWASWPVETGRVGDVPRRWPPRIWKHYYAMPAHVWRRELAAEIPPDSGVLAVEADVVMGRQVYRVAAVKRAKPCRDAEQIGASDAVKIARLASLRYWDVLCGKTTKWTQ